MFDYGLSWVWDIKVHTSVQTAGAVSKRASSLMLLNDEQAVRDCVMEQGLGFLVVSGAAVMDRTGEFKTWHDAWKASRSRKGPAPSNSGVSRMRKASFQPLQVDAYWVPDPAALDAAILAGELSPRSVGRQPPRAQGGEGAPRRPKIEMNTAKAERGIRVATYSWPAASGRVD